jgi:DNA-binding CsgD family transcriptional regulator
MYQHSANASVAEPRSARHIDDDLWARIDAAIGGSARYTGALMLDDDDRQDPVMVVVVERRGLPDDHDLRRRFELTARESEVARLMVDRLSNFEIARRLGISVHTVRRHGERVLAKLRIHSRNDVRAALTDPGYAPALRYAHRYAQREIA